MTRPVGVAVGLLVATLLLGLLLRLWAAQLVDPDIVHALAGLRSESGFWIALSWWGSGPVRAAVGIAAALVLLLMRRGWAALVLLTTALVQTGANSLLKALFARARPELLPHLDHVFDLSYPSGHAAENAALYGLIALLIDKRLLIPFVPLVLLIGISRTVLGVHWPSDVLGGWMEGAAFALLGWAGWRHRSKPLNSRSP